jgi:molybdopterin-binding protein
LLPGGIVTFGPKRSSPSDQQHRDMPYRRAVADICRADCRLSRTILSFSSSDQRRRRPVSTTSSRSTWALRLSLSIETVLNTELQLNVKKGATTSHVRVDIGAGQTMMSSITNEAVDDLGIKAKDSVTVVIKASDVMIAVD